MSRPAGDAAEALAARHLASHGYRILARNVGGRVGELDVVALDHGVLCFVEVRLRRRGAPEDSIGPAKRRRLVRAAERYLVRAGRRDALCRFDVVAVDGEGRVTLIKDAFES